MLALSLYQPWFGCCHVLWPLAQEGRWKWSVEYHGKYRSLGDGWRSSFCNRYIMVSMIWCRKSNTWEPLLGLRCVNCVNGYYHREVFSGLTLKSIHPPLIHYHPGQMARSLTLFHHSRSSDKQAVGWWVPSQRPDGWGTSAEKAFVRPLALLSFARLQRSSLGSRGQWWSFTSASLICFCSSEREALSQYSLFGCLTKISTCVTYFYLPTKPNTSLGCMCVDDIQNTSGHAQLMNTSCQSFLIA